MIIQFVYIMGHAPAGEHAHYGTKCVVKKSTRTLEVIQSSKAMKTLLLLLLLYYLYKCGSISGDVPVYRRELSSVSGGAEGHSSDPEFRHGCRCCCYPRAVAARHCAATHSSGSSSACSKCSQRCCASSRTAPSSWRPAIACTWQTWACSSACAHPGGQRTKARSRPVPHQAFEVSCGAHRPALSGPPHHALTKEGAAPSLPSRGSSLACPEAGTQ